MFKIKEVIIFRSPICNNKKTNRGDLTMETQTNLEKAYFDSKELFVGIDVHKAKWVVTVRSYDLELKTFSIQPVAETL